MWTFFYRMANDNIQGENDSSFAESTNEEISVSEFFYLFVKNNKKSHS